MNTKKFTLKKEISSIAIIDLFLKYFQKLLGDGMLP